MNQEQLIQIQKKYAKQKLLANGGGMVQVPSIEDIARILEIAKKVKEDE
ncbi:hypothetical protein ACTWP4_18775 [Gracilibacillus sp. D59]